MRSIDREILRLSVPAVVSNLAVPLLGLSDTFVSGHLGSSQYIAGIAMGSLMMSMAFWLFGFLRMGTTGLTAQAYGAGDSLRARVVLSRAFLAAMAIGLLIIGVQTPLADMLVGVIGAEREVAEVARGYFRICVWGAPALLATMSLTGWLLGMQTTLWPMIVTITMNSANIALSLLLVFGYGLGYKGVAYGTLCANWLGLLLAIAAARIYFKHNPFADPFSTDKALSFRRFLTVNTDIFLRSACMMTVTAGVMAAGARIGSDTLAANAVLMQFFTLFSYFMDGFAFTGEALCGRFEGAGRRRMLSRCVVRLFLWAGGVAVAFTLLYLLFGDVIAGVITDVESVRTLCSDFMIWVALVPLVATCAFIFDGVFIGMTATRCMLASTAFAAVAFFAILALPFPSGAFYANARLWTAFLTYLAVRGIILGCLWPRVLRPHSKLPL